MTRPGAGDRELLPMNEHGDIWREPTNDCIGETMTTTNDTRQAAFHAAAQECWEHFRDDRLRRVRVMRSAREHGWTRTTDDILEGLLEEPLAVDLVAVRPYRGECDWQILLGTGGPATRVLVTTDRAGTIEHAQYQYQDWFMPWHAPAGQGDGLDDLVDYANLFYFGEVSVTVDGAPVL